jgi:quercetin dioxygenase-like cupin family protein
MSEPTVIPPGGGEIVGDSADRRVEILTDHEALNATWSRFGPRREGADLHIHRRHTDLFYVLAGELTLRLGRDGDEVTAQPGTLARVPPLVVHGFRNASDRDMRYLNFHAPGQGFADYMRALRDGHTFSYDQHDPPADGGRPIEEAVVGGGERAMLLADVEEIAVAELRVDGDGDPHVHAGHLEALYVLEGELMLTLDGREQRAAAGTWVHIPPGVAHALSGSARILDMHAPGFTLGARDTQPA